MRRWARPQALWICAASALTICPQAAQAGSRFATSSTERVEEAAHLDFTIRIPALIVMASAKGPKETVLLTPAARKSSESPPDDRFSVSTNAGTLAFAPTVTEPSRGTAQDALTESPVLPNIRAYVVAAP